MRKLFTSVLMAVMPLLLMAQGWPANYGGVMLQSFEWDGYDATKWSALTANSDELSQCFDLIWVPQSGFIPGDPASTPAKSMGYNDVYWLKQDSYFGTETELRNMISTFKSKGTGIIADVVINHKNGATNWTDLPNESKNGYTLTWDNSCICNTDECNRNSYPTSGAKDTGDDFDGCRDLDHTNSKVQQNCIAYQKFLLNDLGYAGIRLDMVKGYGGEYTKIYNQATNPTFSVGEYWDGDFNAVMNWVNATGRTSAAFDFPLKYIINDAVGNGNYGALANKGIAGDPNNSRYAVTFIDNHDTGRDHNNAIAKDWSAANAVILAMPGTPCIWVKHYNVDKTSIKAMIFARRAAGVHNQSTIVQQEYSNNGYIIRTKGTNGEVCVQLGGAANNGTPSGMKLVAQGDNYKFFCTSSLDITTPHKPGSITPTPTPTPDPTPGTVTVYFKNSQGWSNVNCYAYIEGGSNNGEWPGAAMTYDADITVNGSKGWWKYTLPSGMENSNVIFNGDGNQYPGAMEAGLVVSGSAMACDGTSWSTATVGGDTPTPDPQPSGKTTVYVKSTTAPYLYVWDANENKLNGEWPGTQMTQQSNGYWTATFNQAPINIIFNNGSGGQTDDITGISGDNYFTYDGTSGYTTESAPVPGPDPTPGTVTVYFKNTQGWSSVNCYAYIEGGSNNGVWPGAAMTYDADITVNGSKGWWKYTLPSGMENSNVIFNGDGNQYPAAMEPGLVVGGSSMACDGTDWSAATVGGGDDPTPQPGGKTTIYVKSSTAPYLYVWDGAGGEPNGAWPGAQMTQKDGDYWVASFDQAPLNAIFHNNQGGDSNQTGNIEGLSGDNYFTYDGTSGYTTESAPVPGPDPTPGTVTVYFKNTQGWSSVNCYAYIEGGSNNGEWPGAAMTYDADITVNGSKGWWKYTLPAGLESANVIFNGDGNQYPAAMEPGLAVGGSSMACDGTDWSAATVGGDTPTPDPQPQPGSVTVYFKNTQGWSSVNCYAYIEGGSNNGEWPGAAMTYDADITVNGSKGWWKYTLPSGMENSNVIFNGDGNQYPAAMEPGLAVGGSSMACDGTDWGAATVGGDTPTPDPQPQPGSVTVYFKNTQGWSSVNCYAYIEGGSNNGEWPGAAMTYDADITVNGSKGWWKYTLPAGLESASVIFNGDGNQYPGAMEPGLAVGGSSMACDGTDWSAATVGGDTPTPDPQPSGKTTIYVKSDVAPHLYVWAYGEPDLNGAWPGNQMTQKEGDYWVASFDKAPVSIIFNDGTAEGGVVGVNQTENIEDISGDNYFTYDGGGNYTQEGSTSIDSVPTVEFQTNNIYTIDGRRIRQNATSLQDLKPGVYIVGGKKIVKY